MTRSQILLLIGLCALLINPLAGHAEVFSPDDVFKVKRAWSIDISPDGEWVAYTVRRTRAADDTTGFDYYELHVVSTRDGRNRPFVTGDVSVQSPRWNPDGSKIAFLMTRGEKAKTQVWVIPHNGGEARQVSHAKTKVLGFRWHPDGERVGYIATTPATKKEKKLKEKGYGFTYYEDNLKPRNVYMVSLETGDTKRITEGITVWTFEFTPDGQSIAASISERNLIDQRYAFRQVYLLDIASGNLSPLSNNPGKLGNFAFSPDGSKLAYSAARSQSDHAVTHAYVVDVSGGDALDLTPPDFKGNIEWVSWRDKNTVVYRAAEGVWNTLNVVRAKGGDHKKILDGQDVDLVIGIPKFTRNFKNFAFVASSHNIPLDVYHWTPGDKVKRLTHLNPWLDDRELGAREVITYKARDGVELNGLLYYPVGYQEGQRYPLVVIVHGGPESRYSNGWNCRYSRPTQVLAGQGYAVFLPNYRSSTGYGPDLPATTLGDPAGKEFDDIADGIDHLVDRGLVDKERVGLGGGSYGGFAAAWFSSYYTDKVRAVCMFVGISDLISKRGTTDIPYEEMYVHSGKPLEEMWKIALERSPIYYAHQSKTAVLIYGGTSDTRVHPSQSLEYFRRLKMNDHPAVRLVQYPGERHGNAKQPGKIDVLQRTLQWYRWYVMDKNPLDGGMPPLDISDSYGIELPTEEDEDEEDKDVTLGE